MSKLKQFSVFSRLLHWGMAVLLLMQLFIGVHMVVSVHDYHQLVSLHKPLGIALLILVTIRLINRLFNSPPALPDSIPSWQKLAAHVSHLALYGLMFALPLVGWAMLSAGNYPVTLVGSLVLPPILPHDPMIYAVLRKVHTGLAYMLFATFVVHLGAALMHALFFKDGVFQSMAFGRK